MNDKEKVEEALEKIDELIQFCVKYNKPENLIDLREIKKILEADEDDGWTPGVVNN